MIDSVVAASKTDHPNVHSPYHPPKKKGESDRKILLGRPGNNLQIGIVGLPNVGKSSLFNALCSQSVPAENFPFCTIEPNSARAALPDERYDWLVDLYKPNRQFPAYLNATDIAGLVKGASTGAGLGNAFLSHVRNCDGIFHVLRAFDEDEIIHDEGSVDPIRDIEIITGELIEKDKDVIERIITPMVGKVRDKSSATPELRGTLAAGQKIMEGLNKGVQVKDLEWGGHETEWVNKLMPLTAKPVIFLVNLSEKDYIRKKNKWLAKIVKHVQEHGNELIIPFSAVLETKLSEMSPEDAKKYCEEHHCTSALPKILKAGYAALNLIHFFTAGADEVKCWTVRKYTHAPQAAGVIHTDFEQGFIMAEVMKYEDLRDLGSEAAVKAAGKLMMKGKEYETQDGDIMHFKFNAGAGMTKKKKKE